MEGWSLNHCTARIVPLITFYIQKEKDEYRILMHIYIESRKMVPKNLFAGQQLRNRHRKETYGHSERGGEGEMCGRVACKRTLPYVKWIAKWNLLCGSENSNGLCVNLEGWDGEADVGRLRGRGYRYTYLKPVEV